MLKDNLKNEIMEMLKATAEAAGYNTSSDATLMTIIAAVIAAFLSLLGVIFLCLILYGGFVWMTSGGNEAKVYKAKKIIQRSIIGVIIIISSYAISYWVLNAMSAAVDGG